MSGILFDRHLFFLLVLKKSLIPVILRIVRFLQNLLTDCGVFLTHVEAYRVSIYSMTIPASWSDTDKGLGTPTQSDFNEVVRGTTNGL